jgi:hypothetical protein
VVSGDERVTARGVIGLMMRGEGEGEELKYENRNLERLEGGLKKGGGSHRKGERLCGEGRGLAKRGKGLVRSRRMR